jgi:hypothetical protein
MTVIMSSEMFTSAHAVKFGVKQFKFGISDMNDLGL